MKKVLFKTISALLAFLVVGMGVQSITSCSASIEPEQPQEYAFCVFIAEQLCIQGPYISCPAGATLANNCPYNNIPQSSSAGTTQSSSSIETTQSSSSTGTTQSSSSIETTQSSSSTGTTQSSSGTCSTQIIDGLVWDLSMNTCRWSNYYNSNSTVGFKDNAIDDYVNISEEGPVTGISTWSGDVKIDLFHESSGGGGCWAGISVSYPKNTAQNYTGICIEYATEQTFQLRLGGTRTCNDCEPYYRVLLNQSTIKKKFLDFREFDNYGNFDHNIDLANSNSIIFHRGNSFAGVTEGTSYIHISSIKFGPCPED
ncbi:MAG: hypothetical protein LBU89_05725 [Fibromonadaceae bacterium]|jgi:hypothetical protein|nr:hypothetical protein [Fibromonadaceae bacterium]